MKPRICVVYLVREKEGIKPFLDSYNKHPAGIEHDVLFINKGIKSPVEHYESNWARNFKYDYVSDFGLSLRAFGKAARRYGNDYDYFCFLNSWSVILADDWLAKMLAAIRQYDTGIIGATGSYESFQTNSPSWVRSKLFKPFPNAHIRTTGFMMHSAHMSAYWPRILWTKDMEYYCEHGKGGITSRLAANGLAALVVGANGNYYEKEEWQSSHTYRYGQQSNLLIADKQTIIYDNAPRHIKEELTTLAWGTTYGISH